MLEADQASGVEQDRFAGIIGLAPKSSEQQLRAFIAQVTEINTFATEERLSPLFSFYLSKDPAQDGRVTFGGYDVASFAKPGSTDKDIFWSDTVRGEKYWTLGMSGVALKDAKTQNYLPEIKSRYVIMDTGVSYALIPGGDFVAIQDHLTHDYGVTCTEPADSSLVSTYKCSCKSYQDLPDI